MARIRTIKPEFPQSESMGRVTRDARLLFIMLWTLADDSGRLRGNSRMLASLLFPYDKDADGLIDSWLEELKREDCILQYAVDDHRYLQIANWLNHQKIDKPSQSKIPPFDESSRVLANPRERSSEDQGSKDLRIKDQGSFIDAQQAETSKPPQKRKCRIPEDFELTTERIRMATDYWSSKSRQDLSVSDEFDKFVNHFTGNGKPMLDWDACWKTWYTNALQFNRKAPVVPIETRSSTFDQLTDTSWAAGMLPEPR
jgi:hypothetical protein